MQAAEERRAHLQKLVELKKELLEKQRHRSAPAEEGVRMAEPVPGSDPGLSQEVEPTQAAEVTQEVEDGREVEAPPPAAASTEAAETAEAMAAPVTTAPADELPEDLTVGDVENGRVGFSTPPRTTSVRLPGTPHGPVPPGSPAVEDADKKDGEGVLRQLAPDMANKPIPTPVRAEDSAVPSYRTDDFTLRSNEDAQVLTLKADRKNTMLYASKENGSAPTPVDPYTGPTHMDSPTSNAGGETPKDT